MLAPMCEATEFSTESEAHADGRYAGARLMRSSLSLEQALKLKAINIDYQSGSDLRSLLISITENGASPSIDSDLQKSSAYEDDDHALEEWCIGFIEGSVSAFAEIEETLLSDLSNAEDVLRDFDLLIDGHGTRESLNHKIANLPAYITGGPQPGFVGQLFAKHTTSTSAQMIKSQVDHIRKRVKDLEPVV